MKIAIISDSHDNLAKLKKALDLIKKERIKTLLHCGDVASIDTLKFILESFSGKVFVSLGNMDKDYQLDKGNFPEISKLEINEKFGEVKFNKNLIAFTHFPTVARELAKNQKYDLIFYGHTHFPWEEKIGKTKLINPGNIAGLFFPSSFAIYDLKENKSELRHL